MPDTFRVAVIGRTGRGNYGHQLDQMWLDAPQCQLVAVADDNKPGLAETAKKLKLERTYVDYKQMLDEVKPDIVCIASRWSDCHRDMILAAAERGIHMYCEKPMCRSLAEADEIVAACERTHVKLQVAHTTRFSPLIPVVQQLLQAGKIGKILEIRGRGKEDKRGGSEDLWVLGTHIFDLMSLFAGKPEWCFANITTAGKPIAAADVIDGPEGLGPLAGDRVNAVFGLPNGVTGYFGSHQNGGPKPWRFGLVIYGTSGMIEMQTGFLPLCQYSPDGSWTGRLQPWQTISSAGLGQPETLQDSSLNGNLAGAADLIAAIKEDRQPKCSMYEARQAIEMVIASFESQRLGKPVTLPLTNRQHPLAMLAKG